MAEYSKEEIRRIEDKWRNRWVADKVYKTEMDPAKPKYYVLDMFPYPSGAGLHVGHPLGYIASDIVARFKRVKGFNVLHPIGFDAFGLPAEQYAIQTGQHPAVTTARNIETYKRQLRQIGFSFDWDREVQTSDPGYYKWTQWIFMQLFNSFYNKKSDKTEPILSLISELVQNGNKDIIAVCDDDTPSITSEQWRAFDEKEKENFLQKYRIAYLSESMVNWCSSLGTVLSNDEVKDGVSERGGYPVERKKMLQWSMRITAYAERLLEGLNTIDWPEPLKEMQRNWIGKSIGAQFFFQVADSIERIEVFTTRIDTIFGVTFVVLAPEHDLVSKITPKSFRDEVANYMEVAKNRSERERMSDVKRVSGSFTGAYAINPFNDERIPIWISDYVLAGYGTGAVMAVPGHDERDHRFAKHFGLPILKVVEGPDVDHEAFVSWDAKIINSAFMNGLVVDDAIHAGIVKLEQLGIGTGRINYRMRDAIFGRQRYWGEPFPVYFDNGIPKLVAEKDLPITLPEIDAYKPTETGEPPLARAKDWKYVPGLTPGPSPGERGRETSNKKYWAFLAKFSKENRSKQTHAESVIWEEARNSRLGHKIRRQHAIGLFIADFVCLDRRLVIEIDGDYHEVNKDYDLARTEYLNSEGFNVIRFSNDEVLIRLPKVLNEIKSKLDKSPSIKESNFAPIAKVGTSLSPGEGRGEAFPFELTTMPGWAGSSWYWFRYMDPKNEDAFVGKEEVEYWKDVDLYIGGSEHATGHLLYSRFWCKALKDLGFVKSEEPFKKLINQGHIQGVSRWLILRDCQVLEGESIDAAVGTNEFISIYLSYKHPQEPFIFNNKILLPSGSTEWRIALEYLDNDGRLYKDKFVELTKDPRFLIQLNSHDIDKEVYWQKDELGKEFILTRPEVEKMSKSKWNVVNPDDIIASYGADTLRLYEMFLGPLEQSKPWNTNGIDGVFKFLRRFWNLFHDAAGNFKVNDTEPIREELKTLHKTLKKVEQDIDNFSFNTSVSEFMICANELTSLKCNKRSILEPLVIALSPFAPHIAEELWEKLGHPDSVLNAKFPAYDESYLKENTFNYPISINGKVRAQMNFALDIPKEDIEKMVLASEMVMKWTEGKTPKKVIVVPGKIVNVVL